MSRHGPRDCGSKSFFPNGAFLKFGEYDHLIGGSAHLVVRESPSSVPEPGTLALLAPGSPGSRCGCIDPAVRDAKPGHAPGGNTLTLGELAVYYWQAVKAVRSAMTNGIAQPRPPIRGDAPTDEKRIAAVPRAASRREVKRDRRGQAASPSARAHWPPRLPPACVPRASCRLWAQASARCRPLA